MKATRIFQFVSFLCRLGQLSVKPQRDWLIQMKKQKRNEFWYSLASTNGHLSTTATPLQRLLCPYIDSCLSLYKTATFFCPQGSRCGELNSSCNQISSRQKLAFLALYYNREEKSLRHLRMVRTQILDDNKPIKSLKSLLVPFQTSPTLFNFI